MKTPTQLWLIIVLMAVTTISCSDDPLTEQENNSNRITLQFQTLAYVVGEKENGLTITVKFNKPLTSDGMLKLRVDDKFIAHLTAEPLVNNGVISIEVNRGETTGSFTVKPIDNEVQDGSRIAKVRIESLSGHFVLGANSEAGITITDDETPGAVSMANFVQQTVSIEEKNTTGIEYQIHFSEVVAFASEVKIALTSEKGTYSIDYVSEPTAESDTITLQVNPGLRAISFRVRPVDNNRITGEMKINLSIAKTSGAIRKGNRLQETLAINDDELAGKARGYEVTAGSTVLKKFLEYDENGRVSKIHWETYNPYPSERTESYFYDANNRLIKVEKYPGRDVHYQWENGRISRSETLVTGVLREYHEYDYDEAGNLGAVASFYKQLDGSFSKGSTTIFLYFLDGNLYKSLAYIDSEDPENPTLISTKTYDNYIDSENPFPMTEVLPNIKMQTKLPTTYRVEESGQDLLYHMTYEFRPDGLPAKRIASSSNDTQTAVYHYY